jgi:hypothetical protein
MQWSRVVTTSFVRNTFALKDETLCFFGIPIEQRLDDGGSTRHSFFQWH